ncbi:MAG: MFS transporter [Candidatus Thorarchaeota archaeon]
MTETIEENLEMKSNLKGFTIFWSGQLFSILGSSIIQFVLAWWVTVQTESALLLSLSIFIGFIPTVLLTPIAGVFVDRWNRKALIGSADFLQAAATVVLVFLFKYNKMTITLLMVFLAIRGIFQAFHQPSIQALIPIMVPRKHLSRVNSIQYFLSSIIYLIGPLVAALLYKFFPIHQILWLDGITFVIAFIPLIMIKIPTIKKTIVKNVEKISFFTEFKEGFIFIKNKKGLLPMMISFASTNLFLIPLFTLINLYIYSNHGGGESELAFVLAFNQIGTIAGTTVFIFWKGFKKKINGVALGIIIGFLGYIMISFTPSGLYWFMGIGFLIIGLALPAANISSQTIWQSIVPKEKLGRVMSVRIAIAQAVSPIGMILSGLIAEIVDIQYVFLTTAVIGLFLFVLFWIFSKMRTVEDGIVYEMEEKSPKIEEDEINSDPLISLEIGKETKIDSSSNASAIPSLSSD